MDSKPTPKIDRSKTALDWLCRFTTTSRYHNATPTDTRRRFCAFCEGRRIDWDPHAERFSASLVTSPPPVHTRVPALLLQRRDPLIAVDDHGRVRETSVASDRLYPARGHNSSR